MKRECTTSPRRLLAAERKQDVLRLRRQGLPYRQIAEQVGLSWRHCQRIVLRQMATCHEAAADHAKSLVQLEVARLDELMASRYGAALAGDADAARTVDRCIDRRCRLLGLYAPERVEQQIEMRVSQEEARQELERMGWRMESLVPTSN